MKELTADLIQQALDAELEEELGYSRHDYKNKSTYNSRNGYSKKRVLSGQGKIELNIPRDREGQFVDRKHLPYLCKCLCSELAVKRAAFRWTENERD